MTKAIPPTSLATARARAPAAKSRWLAYESNRSGTFEVYVRPYPGPGPEATVSTQGGRYPVWARDGSELFFESQGRLTAVAVDLTSGFRADTPRALFEGRYVTGTAATNYDVAPDGEHFVFVRTAGGDEGGGGARLILVENFLEELRGLAGN